MFVFRKFKELMERLPSPLKNVYIVSILVFAVWMVFFDKHSLITHIKLNRIISSIDSDMENYRKQIELIEIEQALMDAETERYVREKYFMSRENEDVFIIVRE